MPTLERLVRKVALGERIPAWLFYAPLALHWLALGLRYGSLTLPTVSNPKLEAGGLWGESKSALLGQIASEHRRWLADFVTVGRGEAAALDASLADAAAAMDAAGLGFPVVAKPDVGWQGYGVRLVTSIAELRAYLAGFPPRQAVLLQRPIDYDGEGGVYYARLPGEPAGRVIGLGLRYFPHVVGDGRSRLRDLIGADPRTRFKARMHLGAARDHLGVPAGELDRVPCAGEVVRLAFIGSLRAGGLYRDARAHVTPALAQRFDAIAASIEEFYFGRFDVRFASVERLRLGEDFAIIQVNGAGSDPTHVWDPEWPLRDAYRELARFQSLMFEIGDRNRARGFAPMRLGAFLARTWRYNRLIAAYPASS